jgi:hypothetical protein
MTEPRWRTTSRSLSCRGLEFTGGYGFADEVDKKGNLDFISKIKEENKGQHVFKTRKKEE